MNKCWSNMRWRKWRFARGKRIVFYLCFWGENWRSFNNFLTLSLLLLCQYIYISISIVYTKEIRTKRRIRWKGMQASYTGCCRQCHVLLFMCFSSPTFLLLLHTTLRKLFMFLAFITFIFDCACISIVWKQQFEVFFCLSILIQVAENRENQERDTINDKSNCKVFKWSWSFVKMSLAHFDLSNLIEFHSLFKVFLVKH